MKFLFPLLFIAQLVFAAPKLQNADFMSAAQLQAAGGTAAQLLNETKLWSTVLSEQFSNSLVTGSAHSLASPSLFGQFATPANPAAGLDKLYFKSDDQLYTLNSAGVETLIGAAPSAWLLAGNTGTTPGTDFLGTTDAQALVFKTNNLEALRITATGGLQTIIGSDKALFTDATGIITGTAQLATSLGGTNHGNYTAGSVIFAGAGGTTLTEDNSNFFFDDTNNTLALKGSVYQFGTADAFARRQIWNYDTNAVLRLGSWGQDGDATNSSSEGIIVYGDSLTGLPISAGAGGYARVKQNRFGLFSVDPTLPAYTGGDYFYRVDDSTLYYRDNSGTKTFEVTRSNGQIDTSLSTGIVHSDASGILSSSAVNLTTDVSGVLPIINGGTSLTAVGTSNQLFGTNVTATAFEHKAVTATAAGALTAPLALRSNTSLILEDPGAGTNIITMQSPTLAGNWTMTLPTGAGTAGYCLVTDGAGVTSWTSCTSASPTEAITTTATGLTLTTANYNVLGDASSASITITAFAAAGNSGHTFCVKKIDSSGNTVTVSSSDLIDGESTFIFPSQYSSACFKTDGSTFYVF